MDRDPSPEPGEARPGAEKTRRLLAEFSGDAGRDRHHAQHERSEQLVSSGLDLKAGRRDRRVLGQPSEQPRAWREKAKRFGFSVVIGAAVNPHPGPEYYVDAFTKAITPRTKLIAFTHVSSNSRRRVSRREVCRVAREHGVLSLLDGAQSFGVLDVDLSDMQPDFYTAARTSGRADRKRSASCSSKRVAGSKSGRPCSASIGGAVGISQKLEGMGQRDERDDRAFGEALKFGIRSAAR